MESLDTVIIREIRAEASVGPDRWGKVRSQPVLISISAHTPLAKAGLTDDVKDTIHYGDLGKDVLKQSNATPFTSLYHLAEMVAAITLEKGAESVEVEAEALNQFLFARCLSVNIARASKTDSSVLQKRDKVSIKDFLMHIIIGVNPPERLHKQEILVNLDFLLDDRTIGQTDWSAIERDLQLTIEPTEYKTLEAFVAKVAESALSFGIANTVTVRAQKPKALSYAHSSGVQITRSRGADTSS